MSPWYAQPGLFGCHASLQQVMDEAAARGIAAHAVDAPTSKSAALADIGAALEFPSWYGRNLDALEDCLRDLSWLAEGPHLLVWVDPAALTDRGVFDDILAGAARASAGTARPLHVVLLDADETLGG